MKQNYTHIAVLLDRSGSMQKVHKDVIGGFNTFIKEQKSVPGEATITLAQFSDHYEPTYSDVPLAHVAELTSETYRPSGWTALNDALARLVNETGSRLASKPEHERPSKVIVLVITDGEENSSKEFSGFEGFRRLKDMVEHQSGKYSWQFSFLGANLDSFSVAKSYGIPISAAINYSSNSIGTYNAFKVASRGVAADRLVSANGGTMGAFFENESNRTVVSDAVKDTSDIGETIKKYADTIKNLPVKNGTVTPKTNTSQGSDQTK